MEVIKDFILTHPLYGIFILFVLGGIGLPFPEEIVLFVAGIVLSTTDIKFWQLAGICLLAIFLTDSALYLVGYKFGNRIKRFLFFSYILSKKRLKRLNRFAAKFGIVTIFIARFLHGIRGPVCLTSGILRFNYLKFILYDLLAATIFIPVMVTLGYVFAEQFDFFVSLYHRFQGLFIASIFLAASILLYRLWRKKSSTQT